MSIVIAIATEDGLDQICESLGTAALEMLDLKEMGCDNIRGFVIDGPDATQCWHVAELIEDTLANGRPFGRKGMRKLATEFGVVIKLYGPLAMTKLALGK